MNRKDSLKLLEKYTDAIKAKDDAEISLRKLDSEYKVNPSDFGVPFVKIFPSLLGVFLVIALAIRVAISGDLTFKNEMPVTVGIFAGAAVLGLVVAKIIHLIVKRKAGKNYKKARESADTAKAYRSLDYKVAIDNANYKIAEAESVIPVSCHGIEAARNAKNKLLSGKANSLEEATGGYTDADWKEAYTAEPKIYQMPDNTEFAGCVITEATRTILYRDPKTQFAKEGNNISGWKMVLVSLTRDCALGDCDYYETISKLDKFILDSKEDSILIRGLSDKELENLL